MDSLSDNIKESLIIFRLLEDDLISNLKCLDSEDYVVRKLSIKSLYIDINSFIDELEVLTNQFQYEEEENIMAINKFLIVTARARKFLKKNRDGIKKLRHGIYAHNYRQDKTFVDPNFHLVKNHKQAPVLIEEIKILAEIALLIMSKAGNCFETNELHAFFYLKNSAEEFQNYISLLVNKERMVPDNYLEIIHKDMYYIEDQLKCNYDSYEILAKKLKVKLRSI